MSTIEPTAPPAVISPAASLRERLAQRDALSGTSYYGIEELRLKDSDPTRYERFYSALSVGLFSAREVSKFVSASPGSREMGELLFGLLTPEGDPIGISQGLAGSLASMPVAVRWMITNGYEDNPGIREGDIFSGDDPHTMGAIHPGDCFTYLPVFYDGELVAWAAGMNHIMDVGSMVGGSWPPFSQDTFTDGFVFPMTKTGENYEYHAWWLEMWKRRTRAAVFNILDEKMRLSGCQMIERKVHEVVAEFGVDYFTHGTREIIEDSRRAVKRNVRALAVPGRARNATFRTAGYTGVGVLFPLADREYLIHVPVESRVDSSGGLLIDTAGASPWGFHSYNGYPGALSGAVYLSAMDGYAHNTKINQGLMERAGRIRQGIGFECRLRICQRLEPLGDDGIDHLLRNQQRIAWISSAGLSRGVLDRRGVLGRRTGQRHPAKRTGLGFHEPAICRRLGDGRVRLQGWTADGVDVLEPSLGYR